MKKPFYVALPLLLITLNSQTHAEFDLVKKNQFDSPILAPLHLQFGGQIRPQWVDYMGPEAGYLKNGHDGLSRFRFTANYDLSSDTALIGYYERGINVPKFLGWQNHYNENSNTTYEREAYIGIKNNQFGTLTYGRQFGMYYSVIGMKSDVWDNDGHAGAMGNGINGTYDGANRPTRSLMYTKSFDTTKLYANYLFSEHSIAVSGDNEYRRNNGYGLGADYQINKNTTASLTYSRTNADLYHSLSQESKAYHQDIIGSALTYETDDWYVVGTASYYHDFIPRRNSTVYNDYFAGDGYGLEGFMGYTFHLNQPYLKSIQPYVAVDSLRLQGSENFRSNHQNIGMSFAINKKFKIMAEHTFASTSDNSEQDSNWLTMFINF
ncbi:porin [Acinetobacter sp. MD2]|nr:porin [Acinetobacter sp. MD2]